MQKILVRKSHLVPLFNQEMNKFVIKRKQLIIQENVNS